MVADLLAAALAALALAADPVDSALMVPGYAEGRRVAVLGNAAIRESSGLACSRRNPGLFWTHNDSGDLPRLFAFDRGGRDLGAWPVQAALRDWEDLASATIAGRALLLIAETGDNGARGGSYAVHVCEEPDTAQAPTPLSVTTFAFAYEDGPHDCESLAVDATTGVIYLATKVFGAPCAVYELRTPLAGAPPAASYVARRLSELTVGVATAMDMDPTGTRAVVLAGGAAQEFARAPGEDWRAAFARAPRRIAIPAALQPEALCYGADGATLHLTSEIAISRLLRATPFFEVSAAS